MSTRGRDRSQEAEVAAGAKASGLNWKLPRPNCRRRSPRSYASNEAEYSALIDRVMTGQNEFAKNIFEKNVSHFLMKQTGNSV